MFPFDNSFNHPVKIIQNDPIVYMLPEKYTQNNCLSTPENMRNIQDTDDYISNSTITTLVSFDSSYEEHKSKQPANSYPTKSRRSDLKRKQFVTKAERRAEHNAIERARRECLNSKFQKLAGELPNLSSHRRPSKGQIVEKALDWVQQNTARENRYQYQIMQLQNENKRLIDQIIATQEKKNSNNYIGISPVYMPVSPTLSNGSNFAIGNAADDRRLSIIKSQVKESSVENELELSIATDEDDSDVKFIDENFQDVNKTNHCFFEYHDLETSTQSKTYYPHQQYNMKQIMIEPQPISHTSSFIEWF